MMIWVNRYDRRPLCSLLVVMGVLAACSSAPAPQHLLPQDPAERDAVLALLDSMHQDALEQAFERLDQRPYTRQTRTEQQALDGSVIAYRVYTVHHRPGRSDSGPIVTLRDSAGRFDLGLFGRIIGRPAIETDLANPVPLMLPEDPAYLSPRNQESFRYRQLPDTVLASRPSLRVEVTAVPESDQVLHRVRLVIDEATRQLVHLHLERVNPSFLFRERSTFDLQIRPAPDGAWVPDVEQVITQTALPWQPPRVFRTRSTFTDIAPADTSSLSTHRRRSYRFSLTMS